MEGHQKFLEREVLKVKFEAKLEFPGGRGMQNKNLSWREHGYFLELHNTFVPLLGHLTTSRHYSTL